jgi:hypothetical protein
LRSRLRRGDASELDRARRTVSRAQRKALEQAEAAQQAAEALLKGAAKATVDAESKVSRQFEERFEALRSELVEASRRATVAENELELARLELARLRPGGDDRGAGPGAEPVRVVEAAPSPGAGAHRVEAAAARSAARLQAQGELELIRARDEAARLLRAARDEAQALLASALAVIERNAAVVEAVREQTDKDSEAAATLRARLEVTLAGLQDEADRIRGAAGAQARAIIDEAEHQAAETASDVRRRLAEEIVALRRVMDHARDSFEKLAADQAVEHGSEPDRGDRTPL